MILRLQILVAFTLSLFLLACTEDQDFDTDTKTVDIRLDNAEEITLEVVQSTLLTHLYLPIFEFLGEADLPFGAVKVENITVPSLSEGETLLCQHFPALVDDDLDAAVLDDDLATNFYCFDSPNGEEGVALYSFPAKQGYVAGQRVEVKYENFVNELGWVQNGRLTAKYTKTEGLNSGFGEADSVSCLVNLHSDLTDKTKIDETELLTQLLDTQVEGLVVSDIMSMNGVPLSSVLTTRDSNMLITDIRLSSKELNSLFATFELDGVGNLNGVTVIDVVADSVRFIHLADELKIEVYGKVQIFNEDGSPLLEDGRPTFEIITDGFGEPILDSDDQQIIAQKILETYILTEDEKVIVINHSGETTDNQIASINMDQVYSVLSLEVEEVNCQSFERELSASLTKLSVRKDNITYGINGSLHMIEGTEDNIRFGREVRNSSFTTTVSQENRIEVYHMNDFSISYIQGSEFGSYTFDTVLGGSISSSAFPGLLTVLQSKIITGQDGNDRPNSGELTILGQGLERIYATFKDFTVFLEIDFNGDSTGNESSDVDSIIEPSWDDLVNRDFIQPEQL
ncbi:MAG: hypothetical protein ACI9T9_000647 [Oleiphilaceae bacterium]|jgi:hypothetical protein